MRGMIAHADNTSASVSVRLACWRQGTAPRSRGMTLPEVMYRHDPRKKRGRRECRVQAAPMARLQQSKQAAVTTGKAGAAGIPCAMVLRLIARSPRSAGLDSLRRRGLVTCGLIPASGDQDHAPSPSVKLLSSAR